MVSPVPGAVARSQWPGLARAWLLARAVSPAFERPCRSSGAAHGRLLPRRLSTPRQSRAPPPTSCRVREVLAAFSHGRTLWHHCPMSNATQAEVRRRPPPASADRVRVHGTCRLAALPILRSSGHASGRTRPFWGASGSIEFARKVPCHCRLKSASSPWFRGTPSFIPSALAALEPQIVDIDFNDDNLTVVRALQAFKSAKGDANAPLLTTHGGTGTRIFIPHEPPRAGRDSRRALSNLPLFNRLDSVQSASNAMVAAWNAKFLRDAMHPAREPGQFQASRA